MNKLLQYLKTLSQFHISKVIAYKENKPGFLLTFSLREDEVKKAQDIIFSEGLPWTVSSRPDGTEELEGPRKGLLTGKPVTFFGSVGYLNDDAFLSDMQSRLDS